MLRGLEAVKGESRMTASLPCTAQLIAARENTLLFLRNLDVTRSDFLRMVSWLDSYDLSRAARFTSELSMRRFVACHATLRVILGTCTGVEPGSLEFQYNRRGKPFLRQTQGVPEVKFSLAHSDRFAIYALSRSGEVGVDLERVVSIAESDLIALRFFTERERSTLGKLPGRERREAFFGIWTCKEACLKAYGTGLSGDISGFDVSEGARVSGRAFTVGGGPETPRVTLIQFRPVNGFVAALAVEGSGQA